MTDDELTAIFDDITRGSQRDGWAAQKHKDKDTLTHISGEAWERDIDPNGPWQPIPPMDDARYKI